MVPAGIIQNNSGDDEYDMFLEPLLHDVSESSLMPSGPFSPYMESAAASADVHEYAMDPVADVNATCLENLSFRTYVMSLFASIAKYLSTISTLAKNLVSSSAPWHRIDPQHTIYILLRLVYGPLSACMTNGEQTSNSPNVMLHKIGCTALNSLPGPELNRFDQNVRNRILSVQKL